MKPSYLLVNAGAAKEIINSSVLQGPEFDAGAQLAAFIARKSSQFVLQLGFFGHCTEHGLFLLHPTDAADNLVFDLEQADPFQGTEDESLTILHKVLRFAVKHWSNNRPSGNERHIAGTSKFAIFPFPLSRGNGYRLTLETSIQERRITRRYPGKQLLVFQQGTNEGAGPEAQPSISAYRRAFEDLADVLAMVRQHTAVRMAQPNELTPLRVTTLPSLDSPAISMYSPFELWQSALTRQQRAFVLGLPGRAERIEGPAGTGKTMCLILKCVNALRKAEQENRQFHSIFIAHSEATRGTIEGIFQTAFAGATNFIRHRSESPQSLLVDTLQSWCGDYLGRKTITPSQFLDRDAMAAKELRQLLLQDCITEAMAADFKTHRPFLSETFASFLERESVDTIADMLQHEIAVMIKGRAQEQIDIYQDLPPLVYGMPCEHRNDRAFIFVIFEKYAKLLSSSGEYDTDDVVLTALSGLQTPIWRRQRLRDGFDAIFVDETHLFNLNELSIFHHLTRSLDSIPIVYSLDRAQAPGDRGLTSAFLQEAMLGSKAILSPGTKVSSVFRCSPEILAVAQSVTASGASLFMNFENPLEGAASRFTASEERRLESPVLYLIAGDNRLCSFALERADILVKELECSKADILLVAFSRPLLEILKAATDQGRRAIEVIEHRGDLETVRTASKHASYVAALPEYVGGLEFKAVLLLGVDDGRVPPNPVTAGEQSRHFLQFRAHNHLYVAMTRARYRLEVFADVSRGPSKILANAISQTLIKEVPLLD